MVLRLNTNPHSIKSTQSLSTLFVEEKKDFLTPDPRLSSPAAKSKFKLANQQN